MIEDPDTEKWKYAIDVELENHENYGTWELTSLAKDKKAFDMDLKEHLTTCCLAIEQNMLI